MTSIERILCPIDFSDISQHALGYATAIARWYEARLTVLFVYSNVAAMDLPPLILDDVDRERLLSEMRRFASCVPSTVPVDFLLQEAGFAHDEIVAQASATRADLLVLGTHGRSGFQHLFLGSVTEKVMRKAACPTLIVPPRVPETPAPAFAQFRRILCPIDFSDSSLAALEYAFGIAEETDAQLTLLHVVEIPPVISDEPAVIGVDLSRVREVTEERARQRLHDLVPEQVRAFCTIDTAVIEGRAHREILRQAAEQQSDLVVMGVHGRGALDLLVFGSTTHHVIRASACPVLIVRQGG
jgi:nucleotide-binding universal stress UspA family protein